ncbi:MAG: hypothetical protein J0649_08220, partial [Methylococcales bacterium]|nr:hypothetical protein [Methylococcales bacterium]
MRSKRALIEAFINENFMMLDSKEQVMERFSAFWTGLHSVNHLNTYVQRKNSSITIFTADVLYASVYLF